MKNITDRIMAHLQLANEETQRLMENADLTEVMHPTERSGLVVVDSAIAVAIVATTQLAKTLNLKGD